MRIPELKKVNNSKNIPLKEYLELLKKGNIKTSLEIYIELVMSRKIKVGKYLKMELLHYKNLIEADKNIEYDCYEAERAVKWIENFCRLYEGDQAGEKIKLSIWQKAFINSIFGFFHYENTEIVDDLGEIIEIKQTRKRLAVEFFLLIASGNGKTTLSAAISNYILNGLGLVSPKMYIAANTGDQAKICWKYLVEMINQDPKLKELVTGNAERPYPEIRLKNKGLARAFSNNGKGQEGVNPNIVIFDEVHEFKVKEAQMVADLKKNKVKQSKQATPPLFGEITTAGYVRNNYFDNRVNLLKNMLKFKDKRDFKTVIWLFEQDSIEELEDITNAQKSNPQMGYSLEKQALQDLFNSAKNDVTVQSKVFTKNFNFPGLGGDLLFGAVHMDYPSIPQETMFKAKGILNNVEFYGYKVKELEETDREKATLMMHTFYERPTVFIGFDGANGNNDLSVVTFLTIKDGIYYVKQKTFLLEQAINERIQKDGVDYNKYVQSGELVLIKGDRLIPEDFTKYIDETIEKDFSMIGKIGIDPYDYGANMVRYFNEDIRFKYEKNKIAIPMSNDARYRKFTTPIIHNLKYMFENKKIHSNSQILKMCMANCELKEYGIDGTVSIIKIGEDPRLRIDAVWSLIYAIKAFKIYELEQIGGD